MIYEVYSPDGFTIEREPDCYPSKKAAKAAFEKWKQGFNRQGYYSSNNGRISLNDLINHCEFRPVKIAYWQPEFNDEGNVVGHEYDTVYSFQVWRSKKNLQKEFPKCVPLPYVADSIEEPTYMDPVLQRRRK